MPQIEKYEGLQRTFSSAYTSNLKSNIKSRGTSAYLKDTFTYNSGNENIYRLRDVFHAEVELDSDKSDLENAIAFYEAYKSLPPLIASEESFWTYMTHVEYYSYVKNRWKVDEKTSADTIGKRFFCSGGLMDNTIARLWWSVYLSIDPTCPETPYHYTEVLLKEGNSDLLQNFTKSRVFRHSEAVRGVLRFFKEHTDRSGFSALNRYIIQRFNRLGGVKQLIYMDEDFFYRESKIAYDLYKKNLNNSNA